MMHLLLLLACAAHRGPLYDPGASPTPEALSAVLSAQDAGMVFDEAIARREAGDFEGARQRLLWLRQSGDSSPEVLYQLGVTYELQEDFATALSIYDLMIELDTDKEYPLDAGFRRALCLEELGRYEESYRQYRRLPTNRAFDRHDRYTLDIAVGISALRSGREAEGLRLIRTSLMAVDGTDEVNWMAAKGHFVLATHALDEAATLRLDVRESRAVSNLQRRAGLIQEAEQHVIAAVKTGEPEWIMASLLALGHGYMALHDELVAAPAPKKLSADEAVYYQQVVAERAAVLLRKAWESYDQGLTVAGRFAIENRYSAQLREARDSVPIPGT